MRTTSDRAKWRSSFVLVGVAALVAGTLACGGDDGTDTASAGSSTPATSSTYGVIGDSVEETTEASGAPYETIVTEVAAPTDRMSDVTLYAPDTDGSWPVTVLFSGWGSSRSVLDPFARTLAAEGVGVATVDSGAPDEILEGEYECSQRLAVLSAWDSGADPAAPVAVGGHSMGAGLALMASVFDPFISLTTGGPLDCGLDGEDALPPVDLVIGLGGAWAPAECDALPGIEGLTGMVAVGVPASVGPYDGNPSVPILMSHGSADGACPLEATRAASPCRAAPSGNGTTFTSCSSSQPRACSQVAGYGMKRPPSRRQSSLPLATASACRMVSTRAASGASACHLRHAEPL